MTAELLCLAVTHRTAPLALREHLRPDADKQAALLRRSESMASGRLLLSTCERFEVYASGSRVSTAAWVRALAGWFHLPAHVMRRHVERVAGDSAAFRMLRVAAGLESRVPGEPQILGQVREALRLAQRVPSLDATLHALSRSALRAGRRVRSETSINRNRRSIATLAVERVAEGEAAIPLRVVLVGSGRMAEDVAAELGFLRRARVVIAARNTDRASDLARRFRFERAPFDALGTALLGADAAVVCTSSPTHVIGAAMVAGRSGRPLTLVDLSVPRNVDPDARLSPGVRLFHLEDLLPGAARVVDEAPAASVVEGELSRFLQWRTERRAAPRIQFLVNQRRCEGRLETLEDRRHLHLEILRLKGCLCEQLRTEAVA